MRIQAQEKEDSKNGFKPEKKIDTKYGQSQLGCPGTHVCADSPYMRWTEGAENTVIDLCNLGHTRARLPKPLTGCMAQRYREVPFPTSPTGS